MMARKHDVNHVPLSADEVDLIAECCHGEYVSFERAVYGRDVAPWPSLDEDGKRLAREGVVRQFDEPKHYTAAELHERWIAEKKAAGWTHGPVKDAALKTHPSMVPWSELPIEEQQKDSLFSQVAGNVYYMILERRKR